MGLVVHAASRVKAVHAGVQIAGVAQGPEHGDDQGPPSFLVSLAPHRLI